MGVRRLDLDELAALEDQRDHLLTSIEDLEAEFEAGDISDDDYETLRDDYTARAASVIRAVESGQARLRTEKTPTSRLRTAGWVVGLTGFAVVAGFLIAQAAGTRGSNQVGSGEVRQTERGLLFEAQESAAAGEYDAAIETYTEVIDVSPANVEAFTYRGWMHWQNGDADAAIDDLEEAVALDPLSPDARAFRSVIAVNQGRADDAAAELAAFYRSDPPDQMIGLVAAGRLRERTAEELASQGRILDSLTFTQTMLDLRPGDVDMLSYRGWVLARAGAEASAADTPEAEPLLASAEEWLDQAVEADPNHADTRVFRAFLFRFLERLDEARAELAAYDALEAPVGYLDELIAGQQLRESLS